MSSKSSHNGKSHHWTIVLLKRLILLGSWGYVLYRFIGPESINFSTFSFQKDIPSFLLYATALLCLMGINWSLESLKWKISLSGIYHISFFRSILGVVQGLSVAIFTPNRSGEYIGRIWVLPKKTHVKAVAATIFASMTQLSVTILCGIIAFMVWQQKHTIPFIFDNEKTIKWIIIGGISIIALSLIIIMFFKKNPLSEIKKHIQTFLTVFFSYSFKKTTSIWLLSFVRYQIFIFQYWILLHFFNAPISIFDLYSGLGIMYLTMALLPILTFAEPAVRTALSLLFLGVFSTNEAGIISASIALWIINLAIPSLVGSILLNTQKSTTNA